MSDNVTMWTGSYLLDIGFPMVVVTTQDRRDNEYPGEYFLWTQEFPSLKFTAVHQLINGVEPNQEVLDAGIVMSQEMVEEQALGFAKGQIRQMQFDTYKDFKKYDPSFLRDCDLTPVDWKKSLLTLRWQDRLSEKLLRATASDTLSTSLRDFLNILLRIPPLTKSNPCPYDERPQQ